MRPFSPPLHYCKDLAALTLTSALQKEKREKIGFGRLSQNSAAREKLSVFHELSAQPLPPQSNKTKVSGNCIVATCNDIQFVDTL